MYTVDGVMVEIGVQSDKASSGIEKLANTLNTLKGAVAGSDGLTKLKVQIQGVADKAETAGKKFSGFTKQLVALTAVTKVIRTAITKSNEYVENMNLFRVALGGYADEAQRYAETVERVMGIDQSEWMKSQGIFMQIASGFGMAEESAYKLSKALTQVSYDIASFYNISTEEAMLKVRSGISGELEPLRNLGYALDTATLQQIAYANGINMKVTAMTQAQKAELRYVAIMSQSKNAINDMSRTYNTSANQIRVLSAQVTILARSFGNILIPAINAVLPFIINFVNVLSSALKAIANLFGFSMPSVDWGASGLGAASDAAGTLGDNLGGATGSAKKLQKVLMGFDELNVMPDTSGGGGGGGGGTGGGLSGGSLGINIDDYMYDFLDGMYKKAKDVNWAMAGIAAGVAGLAIPAATLLGWKNLSNVAGGIVVAAAEIMLNFRLAEAYLEDGSVKYLIGELGMTTLAGGIYTAILKNSGFIESGKAWRYGFALSLVIDAGVTIAAVYKGLSEGKVKLFDANTIISNIKTLLEAALAGFLVAGWAGAGVGIAIAAAAMLVVTAIAVDKAAHKLDYGDISLTAEEIRATAEKILGGEVVANMRLADAQIANSSEAEKMLQDSITALTSSSNLIRFGVDTSEEAITAVKNDAATLLTSAYNLLTEQEKTLGILIQLTTPEDGGEGGVTGSLQGAATNAIEALRGGYENLGMQLSEAIEAGLTDGMSDTEAALIANLTSSLTRVSAAISQGEFMGGYVADVKSALSNLDKESFEGVFAEIQTINSELETSYTAFAKQQYADMQGQLDGLKALKSSYEELGQTESAEALTETIAQLEAELDSYDVNDVVSKMMQSATANSGQIIYDTLIDWVGSGNNSKEFGREILNFINAGAIDAANNGDYSYLAESVLHGIERAFEDNGLDLSSIGLSGIDFISDEFKNVISDMLVQSGNMSQEQFEQFWLNMFNSFPQEKIGKTAAQETIAAIKSEFETSESELAPVTTGMAETISEMLGVALMFASQSGDYTAVTDAVLTMFEGELAKRGLSLDSFTFHGTELLTNSFRAELETALSEIGIPQNVINQLWTELNNAFGNGIVTSITNSKTGAVTAMSTVIDAIKREANSSLVKIKVGLQADGSALKVTGAGGTGLDIKTIQLRAGGGIPDYGTMFIAGEAGPEIVGKIGNKTGVANSGQISEIIASEMARQGGGGSNDEAVARAVASALSGMELKVDGDSFGRIAVKTINKRRQTSGKVELIL